MDYSNASASRSWILHDITRRISLNRIVGEDSNHRRLGAHLSRTLLPPSREVGSGLPIAWRRLTWWWAFGGYHVRQGCTLLQLTVGGETRAALAYRRSSLTPSMRSTPSMVFRCHVDSLDNCLPRPAVPDHGDRSEGEMDVNTPLISEVDLQKPSVYTGGTLHARTGCRRPALHPRPGSRPKINKSPALFSRRPTYGQRGNPRTATAAGAGRRNPRYCVCTRAGSRPCISGVPSSFTWLHQALGPESTLPLASRAVEQVNSIAPLASSDFIIGIQV